MSAQTQASAWMPPLQALVENSLPPTSCGRVIGLIGDHPSTYARSPHMWQPALAALGIDASYLPLDVRAERLPKVVRFLRQSEACLGANVTVPYKEMVVPLLDEIDGTARAVGAVNTIVRSPDGRLIGANTDGTGLRDALLRPVGGAPVVNTLAGATVLVIGAGGAGRAAAIALAPLLSPGDLLVTNRSVERARAVTAIVSSQGHRASAIPDALLDRHLPGVTLVINATTRGQAGIFKESTAGGRETWTCLEPYSALAPASPARLPAMAEDAFLARWLSKSAADIAANHARSRERIRLLPRTAAVFDMIYAPSETVLLRHAREEGLATANGRGMNIAQAVAACVDHICRPMLVHQGIDPDAARGLVLHEMARAWDG
ncbi:MAG: shikimate dehydrogenase family protein [Armatimonadota bacterium]